MVPHVRPEEEAMIIVSRLNGERFGVNAEHVERVEEMPDTVLTLVDGKKYLIRESLEDVIALVVAYRARILRVSYEPAADGLRVVESRLETSDDNSNGDH
jgi:flagellar protein FlbD